LFDALPHGVQSFVLDHESTDATAEIARSRGARVVVRPFEGFVNARRFALAQVKTPWTLMIDADERPDAALREAIIAAPEDADGYTLSRTTYYCGKPLRMWSDERLLRLFRTDRVRLEAAPAGGGEAQLHERWICEGRVRELRGVLEHYS
jgi:glycosyltransferase involved in cell wall biosynthesis